MINWLILGKELRCHDRPDDGAGLFYAAPYAIGRIFLPDASLPIYADAATPALEHQPALLTHYPDASRRYLESPLDEETSDLADGL